MPRSKGPAGDPHLADLIRGVYEIYQSAGGRRRLTVGSKGKYSGEFYDLMKSVLDSIGEKRRGAEGLGKAIQEALPEIMEVSPPRV